MEVTDERQAEQGQAGLVVFSGDCRVKGNMAMTARLTDALNTEPVIHLSSVLLQPLDGAPVVGLAQLDVARHEVLLVAGDGPPGDEQRRANTTRHRVRATIGPYAIEGALHARRGVLDPLARLRSGGPMVPITEATIEYETGGHPVGEEHRVVWLNRDLLEGVELTDA